MKPSFLVRSCFEGIRDYEQVIADLEGETGFLGSFQFENRPRSRTLHLADECENLSVDGEFDSDFYFSSRESAENFKITLKERWSKDSQIQEIAGEDWNQKWRESYTGVEAPPFWKIVPEWNKKQEEIENKKIIRMNPSLGFGTGEHPTTQLCLSALANLDFQVDWEVMDFGSGSGILSVAAAMMGAKSVDAIEIDDMALESSREIFKINNLSEKQIRLLEGIPQTKKYNLILANILFSILKEKSQELVKALKPNAALILSGFFVTDVEGLAAAYLRHLPKYGQRLLAQDDWACLILSPKDHL